MNTLQKLFSDALKREGKIITTYYKSESVPCLFRQIEDYNNSDEHIRIFYDISAPIKQGQLLSYGDKYYIVMNQESVSNDTYYKSSLLECNIKLPVIVNGINQNIPAYAYNMTSPTVIENNVLTTLDGVCEIITETTDQINMNLIDEIYYLFGGYYKVRNLHTMNGISHIYVERVLEPPKQYTFEIISDTTSFDVGTSTQIIAKPMINNEIDIAATIIYSSSDKTIATVDENGVVSFLSEGMVIITGTWIERSISDTITFVVKENIPETPNYTMIITASGKLIIGGSQRTFTPLLKDNEGNEYQFTARWTINYNGMPEKCFIITYDGNKCMVKVKDDYEMYNHIGKNLVLICTTDDGLYSATYNAMITAGY